MIRVTGLNLKDLRNRSSKDLIPLTKIKPAIRSLSNAALAEMARQDVKEAIAEQTRRDKRHDYNVAHKARYQEKLAAKRASKNS